MLTGRAQGPAIPSRRLFIAAGLGGAAHWVLPRRAAAQAAPQDKQDDAGRLYNPNVVQQRSPTTALDNDEYIKEIEKGLRCTCGCNLDIYTCRTTDFSCQTSPALHREILALHRSGRSAQEIRDDFVSRYGSEVLMAPKPEGFNLAGYLVPGSVVLLGGILLTLHLLRKRAAAVAHADAELAPGAVPQPADASPEELEQLRQALLEDDT